MDKKALKTYLLKEQQLLHTELTELGVQNLSVPEDWIATPEEPVSTEADENVVADRSEEWMERRGEVAQLETRYNNILRAIEKMKTGMYGTCEVCGVEIEDDRLNANPAAKTCKAHLESESSLGV